MKYDMKALAHDFWYGKPHQERRLGDLYIDKTGLYKHREWRGFKDTMYYFYNIWMYNYAHMVMDVVRYGGLINFAKGVWRYRWVGQTYLPVLHWFDRGMEGMRGEGLKASAWHYRGMVMRPSSSSSVCSPPTPTSTAARETTDGITTLPTTRPSGAACSIPGTAS
ncbi:MAG: hypothetical protein ACLTG4_06760 [Oscillospiraceae bacterium]